MFCLLIVLACLLPVGSSACVTVPTPEQANAARSQTSIFEGHVILTINQRTPLAGIDKTDTARIQPILKNLTYPWHNRAIPYTFVNGTAETVQVSILSAMDFWQRASCVTFRPVDMIKDYEFLMIGSTAGNGCVANLGMVQEGAYITNIKLEASCASFAIAADMLAHTLGVYSNGGITDKPSVATIAQVNELYKCAASCPTPLACLNGGSASGKDCSTCVCPAGWSGARCDETSPGTQLIQVGDSRDVTLSLTGAYTSAEEKVVIVQAPAGKKLQATVKSFGPDCFTTCTFAGLEISGSTSDRAICSLPSTTFTSSGNSLTLRIFRNANYQVSTTVSITVV